MFKHSLNDVERDFTFSCVLQVIQPSAGQQSGGAVALQWRVVTAAEVTDQAGNGLHVELSSVKVPLAPKHCQHCLKTKTRFLPHPLASCFITILIVILLIPTTLEDVIQEDPPRGGSKD